jgi:hypothetical protein
MARPHKPRKSPHTTNSSIRLTDEEKDLARKAAEIETLRTGRRVTWTGLVAAKGIAAIRRIVRRAEEAA